MKPIGLAVAAAALGIAIGLSWTYIEFSSASNVFQDHNGSNTPLSLNDTTPGIPKMVIEGGSSFNFGTMERNASRRHEFVIKNEGEAPLIITPGQASCPLCVETSFSGATVAPGDKTTIIVRYHTRKDKTEFAEGFSIQSDDPNRPIVQLRIEGIVVHAIQVVPTSIALPSISTKQDNHNEVKIYSFVQQPIQIESAESIHEEYKEFYDVKFDPMPAEMVAKKQNARSGALVRITVKKGMPFGPFQQLIRLKTNLEETGELEIVVRGNVQDDIIILLADNNILNLKVIESENGIKKKFFLTANSVDRDTFDVKVEEVFPANILKVKMTAPNKESKSFRFVFEVSVPPGANRATHLGGQHGEVGRIVIATNHPDHQQITIKVPFAVK